jgi:hypothetical protein
MEQVARGSVPVVVHEDLADMWRGHVYRDHQREELPEEAAEGRCAMRKTVDIMRDLVAHSPPIIAECGLAFPSTWYAKPGEIKTAIWQAKAPWRPYGLRLGNLGSIVVIQVRSGSMDNLIGPIPGNFFGPALSEVEYELLGQGGVHGQVIDVPYTKYKNPLPVFQPCQTLTMATIASGDNLRVDIKNIGATPEVVIGAVFFARPYTEGAP